MKDLILVNRIITNISSEDDINYSIVKEIYKFYICDSSIIYHEETYQIGGQEQFYSPYAKTNISISESYQIIGDGSPYIILLNDNEIFLKLGMIITSTQKSNFLVEKSIYGKKYYFKGKGFINHYSIILCSLNEYRPIYYKGRIFESVNINGISGVGTYIKMYVI